MDDLLDSNGNGSTTTATADAGASDGAGSPPSSSKANAAGTANTAPAANLHREAFDRLMKGEGPKDVNRDVFKAAADAKPGAAAAASSSATTPAGTAAAGAAGAAGSTPEPQSEATRWGYPDGTTDKDAKVLKRAQMDPGTWAAIPPSNRVKILTNLKTTQAAADREFQQARAGKSGATGKDAAGAQATQIQTPSEDGTNPLGEGDEGNGDVQLDDELSAAAAGQGKGAAAPGTRPGAAAPQPAAGTAMSFIDPAELETLKQLGGEDLAQTLTNAVGRVVNHFQQQSTPLQQTMSFLLDQHINGRFTAAADALADLPGLEVLGDPKEGKTQREALKNKALLLHRAGGGDPGGYSFEEAVQDAAASLFKTNTHQTAQAALLSGRQRSLDGSTDRGDGRRTESRQLTGPDRARAIFAELSRGQTPQQARHAVDGR